MTCIYIIIIPDGIVMQSFLVTCRNHDVNPRAYLNDVIANICLTMKRPLPLNWHPCFLTGG